jgi:hypothetical protein
MDGGVPFGHTPIDRRECRRNQFNSNLPALFLAEDPLLKHRLRRPLVTGYSIDLFIAVSAFALPWLRS